MNELRRFEYDFQQERFLKELDPRLLAKASTEIRRAKSRFHKGRDEELGRQRKTWERQAALMQEGSTINRQKAEAEYKRFSASMSKHEAVPDGRLFEGYTRGSNPRFHAPNFFNIGYGRSAGGVTAYDTWTVLFGGRSVRIPYCDPTRGLMGVQISAANPGGEASFNTGMGNLFFSQSAQTIPLSASFNVYGWGLSFGAGLGYSRAWVRLGVDAWVSGPGHAALHYYFVNDFWSSAPSPWVYDDRHFRETYATGTHSIAVVAGDLVFASAVVEQGAVCGGLFTGSKSEFLITVAQLEIGP